MLLLTNTTQVNIEHWQRMENTTTGLGNTRALSDSTDRSQRLVRTIHEIEIER